VSRPAGVRGRPRLALDRRRGWLAGVCAGIARSLGTDPAFVRVAVILGGLFFPKLILGAYLVAWVVLDER
jgi:phage shock protein C